MIYKSREEIENLVSSRFASTYHSLIEIIALAYSEAYEEVYNKTFNGNFAPLAPFKKDRLPFKQGWRVEDRLHAWSRNSCGLKPQPQFNSRGKPHLSLLDERFHVTPHRVTRPGEFPRDALYRYGNAATNWYSLPGLNTLNSSERSWYIFLLHGPFNEDRTKLGFVQLGVPAAYKREYLALITIFKAKSTPEQSQIEEIQDNATPSLKPIKQISEK